MLACLAMVPYRPPPRLFDKRDGAMLLRRSGGVGRSHRLLIGGGRLGSACFLIHVGGTVACDAGWS